MVYYILKSYKLKRQWLAKIFEILSQQRNCFFLDTSLQYYRRDLGRYSILGIEPFCILKTKGSSPFKELRENLNRYRITGIKAPLPFFGGAVGYLSYDLGLILEEKIKKLPKSDLGIPDSLFGFYNSIIIIDHFKGLLYILAIGFPEKNSQLARLLCQTNFKKMSYLLTQSQSPTISAIKTKKKGFKPQEINPAVYTTCGINSNFTSQAYIQAVKKVKDYIKKGDIYQVNLSQQFTAQTSLSSFQIYKQLRKTSPSYFSAYFDGGDFQILSSSPERFLRLVGDQVSTRPMKGTRPRGKTHSEDYKLKEELLNSQKDRAELIMIVDLERNDLGRVCSYHSIKVTKLRELEEYRTVFQTTATVSGRLHKDKDRIDLLRACFPGGSITGCPKIRAMEIIEELEPSRRIIYTGNLGYLSFSGDMDFNILIRTILKKNDTLYFGVGGGIVADSRPQAEYQETLVKARGILEAIRND